MDDKDHVFARFKNDKPAASDRREMLHIPRRGSAMGSRAVEVVHMRSGGAPTPKLQPKRPAVSDRAATWEHGFPVKPPAPRSARIDAELPARAEPVTHVMPMWEPAAAVADNTRVVQNQPPIATGVEQSQARARKSERRVADPFDGSDAGANCMRCGYAVEPSREKRGLMTCSACARVAGQP